MPRRPRCLVVGSDGMIGSALTACLRDRGIEAFGTTRRFTSSPKTVLLDLAGDPHDWQIPAETEVVINCAAITGLAACQSRQDDAHHVNCESVAALAQRCACESRLFVHISTDRVYDGLHPRTPPSRDFAPTDEYGRQKAAADLRLFTMMDQGASIAIVRFTKVISRFSAPFAEWRDALRNGQAIRPFCDAMIAPITLDFAVEVLRNVIVERRIGVFQASAETDVTYAEFALELADLCDAPSELVCPVSKDSTLVGSGQQMRFSSLDCSRLRDELGMTPESPRQVAEWFVKPTVSDSLPVEATQDV